MVAQVVAENDPSVFAIEAFSEMWVRIPLGEAAHYIPVLQEEKVNGKRFEKRRRRCSLRSDQVRRRWTAAAETTRIVLVVSAAAWHSACGPAKQEFGREFRADTLANGRILVSNADRGMDEEVGGLRLVEDLRIGGGATASGPSALGRVRSLAVDLAGTVYVADSQAQEVLVFDSEGTFVRRLGRVGRGPQCRHGWTQRGSPTSELAA